MRVESQAYNTVDHSGLKYYGLHSEIILGLKNHLLDDVVWAMGQLIIFCLPSSAPRRITSYQKLELDIKLRTLMSSKFTWLRVETQAWHQEKPDDLAPWKFTFLFWKEQQQQLALQEHRAEGKNGLENFTDILFFTTTGPWDGRMKKYEQKIETPGFNLVCLFSSSR